MELKSCPFCGSEADIDGSEESFWGVCTNDDCGCELGIQRSEKEAATAWNTRHE